MILVTEFSVNVPSRFVTNAGCGIILTAGLGTGALKENSPNNIPKVKRNLKHFMILLLKI